MPLQGILLDNGSVLSWDNYLKSNIPGLFPRAIRYAIYQSSLLERNRWVSASSILYCLRKSKWEFERPYYLKEKDLYCLMRGSFLHEILSRYGEYNKNALVELDLSRRVPGTSLNLQGRLDLWEDGVLYDYKTVSDSYIHYLKKGSLKEEYVYQSNFYKWLLEGKGIKTKEIRIVYVMMSNLIETGSSFYLFDNKRQVEDKFNVQSVPILSDSSIETFLKPKFKLLESDSDPVANPIDWICKSCYFNKECKALSSKKTNVNYVKINKNIDNLF